jgi:CheY-like chemotaxis protein
VKRRRKATILWIDDHLRDPLGYKLRLEESGYEVVEAVGSKEGQRLLFAYAVDAVVVDNEMIGTDGALFAERLKGLKGHVPILLLSAYGPPAIQFRSVDRYFSKSQPPELFLAALHGLLAGGVQPFFYRWLDQWKMRNHGEKL